MSVSDREALKSDPLPYIFFFPQVKYDFENLNRGFLVEEYVNFGGNTHLGSL